MHLGSYKIAGYPVRRYIKELSYIFAYQTSLKWLEKDNGSRNYINSDNNIYLFASPRGGSTWFSQLLNSIPNSAILWEPLFPGGRSYKELKQVGFDWHQPIPQDANWPEAESFFKKLLNREILHAKLLWINDLMKIKNAEIYIYKFCYGNLMLPWLIDRFNIRPVLFLRHPCAVVASQLKRSFSMGDWAYYSRNCRYNEIYKKHESIYSLLTKPEQRLAAQWAIEMDYLLNHPYHNNKWLTVTYEDLILNPEKEVARISKWINLNIPGELEVSIRRPSATTDTKSINRIKIPHSQLSSWEKELTEVQIKDILYVVNDYFGLKQYSIDFEPNRALLFSNNYF